MHRLLDLRRWRQPRTRRTHSGRKNPSSVAFDRARASFHASRGTLSYRRKLHACTMFWQAFQTHRFLPVWDRSTDASCCVERKDLLAPPRFSTRATLASRPTIKGVICCGKMTYPRRTGIMGTRFISCFREGNIRALDSAHAGPERPHFNIEDRAASYRPYRAKSN